MPLELGIAMAVRFVAATAELQRDWLLLVPPAPCAVRVIVFQKWGACQNLSRTL